jgi:hypothetical protein
MRVAHDGGALTAASSFHHDVVLLDIGLPVMDGYIDEAFGRGSDDSARYGLELFRKLNLQLLVVTPLQKIHIRTLEEGSRPCRGIGYEIDFSEINHRQLGRNRVPVALFVPTEADALALIGKRRQADRFAGLVTTTRARSPALLGWIARQPMRALDLANDWEGLLAVILAFTHQSRPGRYLRQLDIAGVDSKFIEARKALLGELLDHTLEPKSIDATFASPRHFEQRYGLLAKPSPISPAPW